MEKVLDFFKKYWAEILVFSGIAIILLLDVAPNYTWVNTDSDGIHYIYAAENLAVSHKTSAPLFLLLGYAFLWLPFGTEFWRVALIMVLATVGASIFIYLIIRHLTGRRSYGCIGALVYGLSALVISQSTIVDVYALVTLTCVGAYYFAVKEQWKRCALMLGIGFAVHFLVSLTAIVLLIAYKGLRPQLSKWKVKNWVPLAIIVAFFAFYLYIPIVVAVSNPVNMWGNQDFSSWVHDNSSTGAMLLGEISIWDLPKRIFDTIGLMGVCFGVAVIPLGIYLFKRVKQGRWYREPLIWLMALPVIIYATNLAPQVYVYLLPTIAFGAVAVGIGLDYWRRKFYHLKYVVLGGVIVLGLFNCWYFDIGNRLDPNLSATKFYEEELDKVPDNQTLLAQQGWEWAAVFKYNKENGRSIIPLCVGTLPSPVYQKQMADLGIKFEVAEDASPYDCYSIAISVIELNDNIWTTRATDPETYGAEIIPARGNEGVIHQAPLTVEDPDWKWMPSNPYDIITGSIEVEEWGDVLVSNYSVLTFFMLGTIGAVPAWICYMVFVKKRKWSLRKHKEVVPNA